MTPSPQRSASVSLWARHIERDLEIQRFTRNYRKSLPVGSFNTVFVRRGACLRVKGHFTAHFLRVAKKKYILNAMQGTKTRVPRLTLKWNSGQ